MRNIQINVTKRLAPTLVLLAALGSAASTAAELTVTVVDQQGKPLPLAVVSVVGSVEGVGAPPTTAAMDQKQQLFDPFVLTVPVGSEVSFPNSDNIRHQVYSFSATKPFELPLYSNQQAPTLNFPQAGVVVLGCNIHDHMRAYIYVSPHQQSVTTNSAGQATVSIADSGAAQLRIWYPRMGEQVTEEQQVTVTSSQQQVQVSLAVSPDAQTPPPLSPLQQRFNKRKNND